MRMTGAAGLGDQVRDLAARESACCSFFSFTTTSQLVEGAESVVLEIEVPTSSKVTATLAAFACAACCALPLLIAAGVLTGAGAAVPEQTLLPVAAGLATRRAGPVVAAPPPPCPPGRRHGRGRDGLRHFRLRLLRTVLRRAPAEAPASADLARGP
jgi:hypothetical protein